MLWRCGRQIAANPAKYRGLPHYVRANVHKTVVQVTGFEVVELLEDPALDFSQPVLPQRPRGYPLDGEGKAYLTSNAVDVVYKLGFHTAIVKPVGA